MLEIKNHVKWREILKSFEVMCLAEFQYENQLSVAAYKKRKLEREREFPNPYILLRFGK